MKQDYAIKLRVDGSGREVGEQSKSLVARNRQAQVIRKASAQFAMTGLHGTTTLTPAKAEGISEAILYGHFRDKTGLFREAVEINSETRIRSLDNRLSSIAAENQIDWTESMAGATTMVCLADASSAILMNWALLEAPEFERISTETRSAPSEFCGIGKSLGVSLLPGPEKLSRSTSFRTRSMLAWPTASGLPR